MRKKTTKKLENKVMIRKKRENIVVKKNLENKVVIR